MTRNIGRTKTRLIRRFLDDEGNLICPVTFSFFPFGGGPRGCVGESVAKIEISPFFAGVLQKIKLDFPPGYTQPDLKVPESFTRRIFDTKVL